MTVDGPFEAPGRHDRRGDELRAAERTRLSWRRTVLSALVVTLLAISKVILTEPRPGSVVIGCLMVIGWLGIGSVARHRMSTVRDGHRVNHSPALVALMITVFAALAAALVL